MVGYCNRSRVWLEWSENFGRINSGHSDPSSTYTLWFELGSFSIHPLLKELGRELAQYKLRKKTQCSCSVNKYQVHFCHTDAAHSSSIILSLSQPVSTTLQKLQWQQSKGGETFAFRSDHARTVFFSSFFLVFFRVDPATQDFPNFQIAI